MYLAIPLWRIYNILRKAEYYLKKEGIGLLVINEKTCNIRKIIKAERSKKQIGKIKLEIIDKKMFKVSKYKFL